MDENEIIAMASVDILERSVSVFTKGVNDARKKVAAKFGVGFREFKANSRSRYGFVRTLLHRDKPIKLEDLYVGTRFKRGSEGFTDDEVIKKLSSPCKIVVQGTAGSGKSVFLRFANIVISKSDAGVLPLFFELKSLNEKKEALEVALLAAVAVNYSNMNDDIFREFASEGRIIFILDGFDEIDHDLRERVALEISSICKKYIDISIVVSSRPDDLVSSMEGFSVFRAMPFSLDQTVSLLQKLPYDYSVKEKFVISVRNELYDKHKDFLSNPLLITMMLMTYHQFAEIPSKIHIFYQQAFEALFSWHDSSKDVFKRKSYTDLPIDEFQRIFAYFCADTYTRQKFSFSSIYLRSALRDAIDVERPGVNVELYISDLLISTCLLQMDGTESVFVHRSFQEYFAALFISRLPPEQCRVAIESIVRRVYSDLVLQMAYEMNPSLIESAWAIGAVRSVISKVKGIDAGADPQKFFQPFFYQVSVGGSGILGLTYRHQGVWGHRLAAISRLYPRSKRPYEEGEARECVKNFFSKLDSDSVFKKNVQNCSSENIDEIIKNRDDRLVYLKIESISPEISSCIKLNQWSRFDKEFLLEVQDSISKRVYDRKKSIKGVFSKKI